MPFRYDGTGFLFEYRDKLILLINKFLADRIGGNQELLVLFKETNNSQTVTKVLVVDNDSFLYDDQTNHNVTIAVLEKNVEASFYRLDENYSPPFPLNNSYVNILAINNNSGKALANFDATQPYELQEFTGKVSYIDEALTVNNLGVIDAQQIVFLKRGSLNFQSQISQGGIVYLKNGEKEIPIGFTNALIKGSLRTFIDNSRGYYWSFTHLSQVLPLLNNHHMISYSKEYNHLVEYYIDNISDLRDKIEFFADELITDKITKLDLSIPLSKFMSDNMIELRGELFSLRFNLFMIEQNLIDKDWWNFSHKNSPPSDKRKLFLIKQFHKTTNRSFVIGFFSVVEHFLREALRRIDPDLLNNATDGFYHVRTHYFESIEFEDDEQVKYKTVLKLFALIRNTIHNDGFYYSTRKDDRLLNIEYNGKTFQFVHGEKFEAQFDDYFSLIEDTIELLWYVFESDYLKDSFS